MQLSKLLCICGAVFSLHRIRFVYASAVSKTISSKRTKKLTDIKTAINSGQCFDISNINN